MQNILLIAGEWITIIRDRTQSIVLDGIGLLLKINIAHIICFCFLNPSRMALKYLSSRLRTYSTLRFL